MKFRIFSPFVHIAGMIALLLLQGCDKGSGAGSETGGATAKQVDMTVLIPIHPSSLEYFNLWISYSDNTGEEYRDTVRTPSPDEEIHYWTKTFAYKSLPVVCRCEVNLSPKVSRDSVVSFSYIIPKPYIFSRVIFSSPSYDPVVRPEIERPEVMKIENIRIGTFISAYESYFASTCIVKESYDGISCISY